MHLFENVNISFKIRSPIQYANLGLTNDVAVDADVNVEDILVQAKCLFASLSIIYSHDNIKYTTVLFKTSLRLPVP